MTIWRKLIIYENSADLSFTKKWSTYRSRYQSNLRLFARLIVSPWLREADSSARANDAWKRERNSLSCANYPLGNREFTLLLYLSSYQFRANLKFATGRTILATMRPNVRSLNRYHARRSSSLGSSQPSSATRWNVLRDVWTRKDRRVWEREGWGKHTRKNLII